MNPNHYRPSWQAIDSPTRLMSDAELVKYYKANAVLGDCDFALRPGTSTPLDILVVWAALRLAVQDRKQTPADKRLVERLRGCWRAHINGWPYTVPALPAMPTGKRKASHVGCCPNCGYSATVAA